MTVRKSPLLWVLRDVLGLRGTKYGCGIGYCAVCTVLIDGRNTKSCQTLAERAVGTAVTTVEGAPATTGPRFSMTRARSRHPGSPDAHPRGRAAAPAPRQRHGDASRPPLMAARSPTSPSVSPGTAPDELPDAGVGASMCCDRRASQPSARAER